MIGASARAASLQDTGDKLSGVVVLVVEDF